LVCNSGNGHHLSQSRHGGWAEQSDALYSSLSEKLSVIEGLFHSNAVDFTMLRQRWFDLVLRVFPVLKLNGRAILVADGIKIAKSGNKMPGVKLLHQESQNNSKPEFIMGHMWHRQWAS